MKKLVLTAAAFAVLAAQALTVTGVSARQRWPWNNLVDIDFTINGDSGEAYCIDISATADASGVTRLHGLSGGDWWRLSCRICGSGGETLLEYVSGDFRRKSGLIISFH